eukprot:TRINITY_DN2801_c1_g2_i1.p1 TRINITY_DN2801_c1_g2~~TRINITY_DN2801_c1_g2_i1.p1  ORF type:complete len:981 (+),score=289.01 TRINITY_DN2801_c1_g2_i1:166-2943(+)
MTGVPNFKRTTHTLADAMKKLERDKDGQLMSPTPKNRSNAKKGGLAKLFASKKSARRRNRRFGRPIDPMSPDAPEVVVAVCAFLNRYALKTTGIFRVSAPVSEVQALKKQWEGGKEVNWEQYDKVVGTTSPGHHVVASLMVMYFMQLPDPLLTFDLYEALISAVELDVPMSRGGDAVQLEDSQLNMVRRLVLTLPPPNLLCLAILIDFLHRLADGQDENKMTPQNLGIVFGPVLFRSREEDPRQIMRDTPSQIAIIASLVDFHEFYFNDGELPKWDDEEEEEEEEAAGQGEGQDQAEEVPLLSASDHKSSENLSGDLTSDSEHEGDSDAESRGRGGTARGAGVRRTSAGSGVKSRSGIRRRKSKEPDMTSPQALAAAKVEEAQEAVTSQINDVTQNLRYLHRQAKGSRIAQKGDMAACMAMLSVVRKVLEGKPYQVPREDLFVKEKEKFSSPSSSSSQLSSTVSSQQAATARLRSDLNLEFIAVLKLLSTLERRLKEDSLFMNDDEAVKISKAIGAQAEDLKRILAVFQTAILDPLAPSKKSSNASPVRKSLSNLSPSAAAARGRGGLSDSDSEPDQSDQSLHPGRESPVARRNSMRLKAERVNDDIMTNLLPQLRSELERVSSLDEAVTLARVIRTLKKALNSPQTQRNALNHIVARPASSRGPPSKKTLSAAEKAKLDTICEVVGYGFTEVETMLRALHDDVVAAHSTFEAVPKMSLLSLVRKFLAGYLKEPTPGARSPMAPTPAARLDISAPSDAQALSMSNLELDESVELDKIKEAASLSIHQLTYSLNGLHMELDQARAFEQQMMLASIASMAKRLLHGESVPPTWTPSMGPLNEKGDFGAMGRRFSRISALKTLAYSTLDETRGFLFTQQQAVTNATGREEVIVIGKLMGSTILRIKEWKADAQKPQTYGATLLPPPKR